MDEKVFQKYYRKLNENQKKAVDTIEGPVMVVAGPGTGKTQILTLRIANILRKTDTPPDGILALTFTKSAVFSMRRRLVEIIGSAAYQVNLFTFHGFCNDVISSYPEEFPEIIGRKPATLADQIKILEKIIKDTKLPILKPVNAPFYHLRSIMGEISRLKRENISPKILYKKLKEKNQEFDLIEDLYHEKGAHKGKMKGKYLDLKRDIEKNEELALIYEKYEQALKEEKLYDFGDMIMEVVSRLEKNKNLLLKLQEQFLYVLADEHQDANQSQNRLLELLVSFHSDPNLFIVGDEKQAIFQFQGASLDNFNYFHKLYPKAEKIYLSDNYRSSQLILDSAHSLITKSQEFTDKKIVNLKSQTKAQDKKISLYKFSLAEFQYRFVASDIRLKIDEGVEPENIAVIYRNNRDAFPLLPFLDRSEIPVAVLSDEDILLDQEIYKFFLLLKGIVSYGEEEFLYKIMHLDFLGLDRLDLYKISDYANKNRLHIADVLAQKNILNKLKLSDVSGLIKFQSKIKDWNKHGHNLNSSDALELILNESGFLKHILSLPDAHLKLEKLRVLFDEAKEMTKTSRDNNLVYFVEHLNTLEEHGVKLKTEFLDMEGVRLMTAHHSKGLEFDVVYILDAYDGHWGNKRSRDTFSLIRRGEEADSSNSIEDERRLFFVALTRAKKEIIISLPTLGPEGKQFMSSLFVEEINKDFITEVDVFPIENDYKQKKEELLLIKPPPVSLSLDDKEFLNKLFLERGLSPTALNNYLKCPWRYYFVNLIRIPKAPNRTLSYGSAVHDALEHFFNKYKENKKAGEKDLLFFFDKAIERQPLSPSDFKEAKETGRQSLSGYYATYKNTWSRNILTEYKIKVFFEDFKLTGKLDKIEFLDGGDVLVVDYKTGKPKSRNHIEGKTKDSGGDYKRQLVFYKLLLDLFPNKEMVMKTGVIDFIEPDKKSGKYRKEIFEITDDDTEELRDLIKQTIKEIKELDFWNKFCDDADCEYCALRKMMK